MNPGLLYAFGCYGLWGFLPVYWKLLSQAPSGQILAHRIVWSLVFMGAVLAFKKDWGWLKRLKENPKLILWFVAISALISVNWFVYIWGVNSGYVVETSLGYFINPLVNVALGVLFLKEKPRSLQWAAIGLAFIGVSALTYVYGRLPWIALTLAFSFGLYGLFKKIVVMGPLRSLALETSLLFFPALGYLFWASESGQGVFLNSSARVDSLLVLGGFITALPLLLFGAAAKNLSMTALGLMQYLAPTIQFMIGVFLYNEPFSKEQGLGFALIWTALALFTFDILKSAKRGRKKRKSFPAAEEQTSRAQGQ